MHESAIEGCDDASRKQWSVHTKLQSAMGYHNIHNDAEVILKSDKEFLV